MKKFIAALLFALLALAASPNLSPAFADVEKDWMPAFFPTMGTCIGDNVRLRDEPGTDGSRIIGKANKFDDFVVLGETSVNGDIWYEIENPIPGVGGLGINDTLWISGKYVMSWHKDEQRNPVKRLVVQLNQTFGSTPEHSRILLGKPRKEDGDTLEWDGLIIFYSENNLDRAEVLRGDWNFGEIRLGDDLSKIRRLLGEPEDNSSENTLMYQVTSEFEWLSFYSESNDGIITGMYYHHVPAD